MTEGERSEGIRIRVVRVRNRRGEGGRLRDEIIDAAAELLDETGDQHAVTLRSVARRVGIATPSIYPHFPDRLAILLAAVQGEFTGLERALGAAAEQEVTDPRRRLLAVCETYLDFAEHHPQRYRMMFGGLWAPTLEHSSLTETDLVMLGAPSMLVLVEALDACVAAGTVASDHVSADATALWAGLHGLAHRRIVPPSYSWPENITERVILPLARLDAA
ncbi:TetR/AcrR family transcriptional regulator [Streptomyces kunmingensis]|uniref:TetR/AcrR family transcriptional regulator n=1 Tax=Streptomyces kunmingensis TaxID=68225 RepID=A0ABU6CK66_9ACTN|nr:TetR/AcrR family transcriptional regulator [Streptomyces kunmingensis]MEB3965098.1 TetR/AcrR family transcriptional regulator [Streptomyces kunmingensis]